MWLQRTLLLTLPHTELNHNLSNSQIILVSPTKEQLCVFIYILCKQLSRALLPVLLSEPCRDSAQQPKVCCFSDKLTLHPFAFPAEDTDNICFLFKFKGISLINCRMQSWRRGDILPGFCSSGICYCLCEKPTFLSPASHK